MLNDDGGIGGVVPVDRGGVVLVLVAAAMSSFMVAVVRV